MAFLLSFTSRFCAWRKQVSKKPCIGAQPDGSGGLLVEHGCGGQTFWVSSKWLPSLVHGKTLRTHMQPVRVDPSVEGTPVCWLLQQNHGRDSDFGPFLPILPSQPVLPSHAPACGAGKRSSASSRCSEVPSLHDRFLRLQWGGTSMRTSLTPGHPCWGGVSSGGRQLEVYGDSTNNT